MPRTKIVGAIIAIVLLLVIALQNMQSVEATILFFAAKVPLAVLLVLSFIVGIVSGLLIAFTLGGRSKAQGHAK